MRKCIASGFVVVASLCATMLVARDTPEPPPVEREQAWLKQLVGEWESEAELIRGPGKPAKKRRGKESTRAIGEFWVVSDLKAELPTGESMSAVYTLGYNPEKKKYVATWIDSVTSHMWIYEGTLDETGKILTMESDGPNAMVAGKTARFRDVIEIKSRDLRTLTSSSQADDGAWTTFVSSQVRRKN